MRLGFFFLFVLLSFSIRAQQATEVPSEIRMDDFVYLLADSANKLSYEEVKKIPIEQFQKTIRLDKKIPSYWVRIEYEHTFGLPTYWYLNFYTVKPIQVFDENNELEVRIFPLNARKIRLEKYYSPITLRPDKKMTLWVRFESTNYKPNQLAISLLNTRSIAEVEWRSWLSISAYMGILLVMMAYHIIIYFFVRDRSYLLFAGSAFFLTFYVPISEGVWADYWGGLIRDVLTMVCSGGSLFFGWLFFRSLLNSPTLIPKIDKWISIFFVWVEITVILTIMESFQLIPWAMTTLHNVSVLLFSVVIIITAFYAAFYKKYRPAAYYLFADIFALIFLIMCLMSEPFIGLILGNEFTKSGIKIGTILRAVFFAIALAEKINIFQKQIRQNAIEKERLETQKIIEIQQLTEQKNKELEQTVVRRTAQLIESNEELNQANEELQTTVETINEQKREIEKAHISITASINYAKRIQDAMLPPIEHIRQFLPETFVFFRPRDIVSGDFYWFSRLPSDQALSIFAVADCTGHGVPGAFMSLIGNDLLNEIINIRHIYEADRILNQLHKQIRSLLKQGASGDVKDGMEIALVVIDSQKEEIGFAGAGSPLVCIQHNELQYIKGSKMPIGGLQKEKERVFEKEIISYSKTETMLYLFTDGFQDQFGGEKNQKFLRKNFKNLLWQIHSQSIDYQEEASLTNWRKDDSLNQTDDILVVGIRLRSKLKE
jgi:two-component system, sensor histidine kinase LadS